MKEQEREVRVFLVHLLCVRCETSMNQTGEMKPVHPPLFVHRCGNCGTEEWTKKKYPYPKYEEV